MPNIFKIKRGNFATMPVMQDGEIAFCRDTEQFFIGKNTAKVELSTVHQLTHARAGTVHTLTGAMPTTGFATIRFKATAAFVAGDTFKVGAVVYTAKNSMGKAFSGGFAAGAVIVMEVDVVAKTLTAQSGGGGGSGGKMVQQLELPLSNTYIENTSEAAWNTMAVAMPGMSAINCSVAEDGILYWIGSDSSSGIGRNYLYKLVYSTKQLIRVEITAPPSGYMIINVLRYRGAVYTAMRQASTGKAGVLYKINEETGTYTQISSLGGAPNTNGDSSSSTLKFYHIAEDKLISLCLTQGYNSSTGTNYASLSVYHYSFSTNTLSAPQAIMSNTQTAASLNSTILQSNPTNTAFRTAFSWRNVSTYVLNVYEFSLSTNSFRSVGSIASASAIAVGALTSTQVGEKMLYLTDIIRIGGKRTGELDLFNLTINTTKYPECPSGIVANSGEPNLHKIGDDIVFLKAGNIYSLTLIPVPPQNKPLVMKLHQGDKYSAPFINKTINVLALTSPSQPAFTITTKQQTAAKDLEIHMGQYELQGAPTQLLIEKE